MTLNNSRLIIRIDNLAEWDEKKIREFCLKRNYTFHTVRSNKYHYTKLFIKKLEWTQLELSELNGLMESLTIGPWERKSNGG